MVKQDGVQTKKAEEVADTAYRALLDIQGLLELLDSNIFNPDGVLNNLSETVQELAELVAIGQHRTVEEVMKDVYPYPLEDEPISIS